MTKLEKQVIRLVDGLGHQSKGMVVTLMPCHGDEPVIKLRTKGCRDEVIVPLSWIWLKAKEREAAAGKRRRNPRLKSTLKL